MIDQQEVIRPNEYRFDFTQAKKVLGATLSHNSLNLINVSFGNFFMGDGTITSSFGQILEPLQADLMDISLFAYLADRLSLRRKRANPQRQLLWARKLQLKIPVRCLSIWGQEENHRLLEELLHYFTEDEWRIEFTARQLEKRGSEIQSSLFPQSAPSQLRVALFSGGLDSFAGVTQQLFDLPSHYFVLVSGVTNPRQGDSQRKQIDAIKTLAPNRAMHVPVEFGIRHETEHAEERSQRTRGFLFMSIGAVTAINIGTNELYIYENGVGAINLPYDGSQLGTANTRAVHPIALSRMSKFISQIFNTKFHIENPFIFKTKSEMCAQLKVDELGRYIQLTFSCDSFPIREKGKPQCGSCTSCLLRRLSLESAGLSRHDSSSGYINDLLARPTNLSADKLRPLFAMEWQAQKLKLCLENTESWKAVTKEFPTLMDIVAELCLSDAGDPEVMRSNLLQLYTRYVREWTSFSARKSLSGQAIAA